MDAELEKRIDDAGRDEVFAIISAAGWTSYPAPPKYVWWLAIAEVERRKQETQA